MWRAAAKYDRDENMRGLIPERPVFWGGDLIAVLNSEGMWDVVSKARVLRDEIVSAEGDEVVLGGGERVRCDAVVAATGWLNCYPMFEDELAKQLGLPTLPEKLQESDEEVSEWEELLKDADREVVETFPRLAQLPSYPDHKPKSTPNKLFRSIIPIEGDDDHSIAFIGGIGTTQSLNVAEVQSLWAAAYLSNKLSLPSVEKMKQEVALSIAWRRRRYLGDGYTFILEQLQYLSMLLRDLGVNDMRKGGGWREILSPYASADYRGILKEWKEKNFQNV